MVQLGLLVLLAGLFWGCESLDNGLARTPQMGYNAWNRFQCNINETIIRNIADAIVSSGLKDAGYTYLNLDDCWQISRDTNGTIVAGPNFASGIKALADYVHSKGLLFGIYSDAGTMTCANRPGSLGYEEQDANTYASWGVDYLKYDNCYNESIDPRIRYPIMRDALNATGRPILFSICEWGILNPATWAAPVGNSWRTSEDIQDTWAVMIDRADINEPLAAFAGPGAWNDPDMLEVGNGGMTNVEYTTHFSLWCLMKAPLLIGNDPTNMTDEIFKILTNAEAIAINQDSLGVQARRVASSNPNVSVAGIDITPGDEEVWAGPLAGGSFAVGLVNRGEAEVSITAHWKDIGIATNARALVRDLWEHKDKGVFQGRYTASVPSHGIVLLKIIPRGTSRSARLSPSSLGPL